MILAIDPYVYRRIMQNIVVYVQRCCFRIWGRLFKARNLILSLRFRSATRALSSAVHLGIAKSASPFGFSIVARSKRLVFSISAAQFACTQ